MDLHTGTKCGGLLRLRRNGALSHSRHSSTDIAVWLDENRTQDAHLCRHNTHTHTHTNVHTGIDGDHLSVLIIFIWTSDTDQY